jgi:hypothetical protein
LSKKLDDLSLKLKSLETLQTLNTKVDSLTTSLKTHWSDSVETIGRALRETMSLVAFSSDYP